MFFFFLLTTMSISVGGQGAAPAAGMFSAAEILEKNLIASGGLEAHQRMQSYYARGDFGVTLDHPQGHFSFSYKAPSSDLLEMKNDFAGIKPEWQGTICTGRRKGERFSKCSPGLPANTGFASSLIGIPSLSMGVMEEDWLSLLQWDASSRYQQIVLIGQEKIDKKLAYAVEFTPGEGDPVVRYYDAETFLLVGMDQVQRFRGKDNEAAVVYRVRSIFRNYRDQDGLKLPRVIAVKMGRDDLLFGVTKIQPNAKIDDSVFRY
ncbi:MAG TPA: hypothetical protein VKH81_17310 [Candidatus Angelobacter sp.]|nr:hypothetical protein [Candidatus Angelobacter sp.]